LPDSESDRHPEKSPAESSIGRRDFLQGVAAGIAGAYAGIPKAGHADFVFIHGHIYTSNPAQPWVEAVAITSDRILAVGSDSDLAHLRGPKTQVIDLGGRMAMPGIIDNHVHFLWGSNSLTGVRLRGATTEEQVRKLLHDYAAAHPGSGWVWGGYGYIGQMSVTPRELLDSAFPDRPALLISGDCHDLWANSKALALAGITRDTPNPSGLVRGEIVRDSHGEATGLLTEGAKVLVARKFQIPRAEQLEKLRAGIAYANQHGVTSVICATGDLHQMGMYAELRQRGQLTLRMTHSFAEDVGVRHTLSSQELTDFAEAIRLYPRTDDWMRAGVIKYFADGVIEGHTAAMLEPYDGIPGYKGSTLYPPAMLEQQLIALDRLGYQIMTHSIGDGASREVLNAYEAVIKTNGPRDRRWRIEHMEAIAAEDWPRLGELHVIAAFQPWCCPSLKSQYGKYLGADRLVECMPWRSIVADGALLSLGSDWPVESLNPFPIMQTAILRANRATGAFFPDQRLSLDQAMAGYTRNNAYTDFMEDRIGSLETGKLADLIVLSQDLSKTPPDRLGTTQVLLTMVGGKIVWRSEI
jgi:predicted amidohydrolase YtcJ